MVNNNGHVLFHPELRPLVSCYLGLLKNHFNLKNVERLNLILLFSPVPLVHVPSTAR